jgi:tetratricopeptide (TPR) repeat protein/thiol-disulfide isomerase/thioredoxin
MRWLLVVGMVAGCATGKASTPPRPATASAEVLPFIEDDYARALAEAREKKRPLFVDLWAPWCHTCRYVRELVFHDPALAREAGRAVWLAIDVDKDVNAPFITRFPAHSIPTFLILDPLSEHVLVTRSAGLDRPQLVALLDEGEGALSGAGGDAADAHFRAAEEKMGAGDSALAQLELIKALSLGRAGWSRRRAAVEALTMARDENGDARGCAELAEIETRPGPRDAWWVNLVTMGLDCIEGAGKGEWRAPLAEKLLERAKDGVSLPGLGVDDRSSLYEAMVDLSPDAEKQAWAQKWLAFLDGETAKAKTPAERAVYDPHRLLAMLAVGDPGRAVKMLQASERDLPDDYNGPARLAIAYQAMGRYDDALTACERALAKVYGPRRVRIEATRADIYRQKGDLPAAKRVLEEALVAARALPPSPRADNAVKMLTGLLEKLAGSK